jgi:hypothetical protein
MHVDVFVFADIFMYIYSLSERTYSLWGYMWQNVNDFVNPLFNELKTHFLRPRTSPQYIRYGSCKYIHMHARTYYSTCISTDME